MNSCPTPLPSGEWGVSLRVQASNHGLVSGDQPHPGPPGAQPGSPHWAEELLGLGRLQGFWKLFQELGAETSIHISYYFTG